MTRSNHIKCWLSFAGIGLLSTWLFNSENGRKFCDATKEKYEDCKEMLKSYTEKANESATENTEELTQALKKDKDKLMESLKGLGEDSMSSNKIDKALKEINDFAKKLKHLG